MNKKNNIFENAYKYIMQSPTLWMLYICVIVIYKTWLYIFAHFYFRWHAHKLVSIVFTSILTIARVYKMFVLQFVWALCFAEYTFSILASFLLIYVFSSYKSLPAKNLFILRTIYILYYTKDKQMFIRFAPRKNWFQKQFKKKKKRKHAWRNTFFHSFFCFYCFSSFSFGLYGWS